MAVKIDFKEVLKDWEPILRNSVLNTPSTNFTINFVHTEYKHKSVFPNKKDIFRAFKLTSFNDVRVIIVGQDPYPNKRATGVAFGNEEEDSLSMLSPSLEKIRDCVETTVYDGLRLDFDPTLVSWAKQGVLLLNSALTVREGEPGSHTLQWRGFIKGVLREISANKTGVVFLLLGSTAFSFAGDIDKKNNHVFKYYHPAFSARRNEDWKCPFFVEINKIIKNQNGEEYCIKW